MFDRIFSGVLAFGVLAAATAAIGTALFEPPARVARAAPVVVKPVHREALAQCDDDSGAASAMR